MRLFVSVPMQDRTEEEILQDYEMAVAVVCYERQTDVAGINMVLQGGLVEMRVEVDHNVVIDHGAGVAANVLSALFSGISAVWTIAPESGISFTGAGSEEGDFQFRPPVGNVIIQAAVSRFPRG